MSTASPGTSDDAVPAGPDPELLADSLERAAEARLWLRALIPIVRSYDHDATRPPAVQQALDSTVITACARIRRIVREELGPAPPD